MSGKTDLLAMNASIEAAHAGNSGRGFAIIAQEIRKLSEETKRSTESISAALNENKTVISEASELVHSFRKAFEGTAAEIRATFDAMEEMIRGLTEMKTANDELCGAGEIAGRHYPRLSRPAAAWARLISIVTSLTVPS